MSGNSHLHLLFRGEGGEIGGDARRLTVADARSRLAGTGYRDEPALIAVLNGRATAGYRVNGSRSWLALTRCAGGNDDACREVLVSVATGGDIRLRQAMDRARG